MTFWVLSGTFRVLVRANTLCLDDCPRFLTNTGFPLDKEWFTKVGIFVDSATKLLSYHLILKVKIFYVKIHYLKPVYS